MKRAVVFAHYDKTGDIEDYVIYYLKELQKVADIVFVSCDKVSKKLNGIHIIDEKHDEYDFGSYKRGFFYLKNTGLIENYDELIFANDSCYGPFYPFEKIFEEMESRNCDFWGITKNNFGYRKKLINFFENRPHIQSYFMVFNKNVFMTDVFENFISTIKHEKSKKQIISKYEIGLSEVLANQGFKFDVLINAYPSVNNSAVLKWRQLILEHKMPFLKRSIPQLKHTNKTTAEGFKDIIKQVSDYPTELIKYDVSPSNYTEIKRKFYDSLSAIPNKIRRPIVYITCLIFPFLRDKPLS